VARLRPERLVVIVSLAGVIGLAWLWLWRQAVAVPMPGMEMMLGVALPFMMWLVMMAAMMLPSATPAILLYGTLVRQHAARGSALPAVWLFVGGYLLAWSAFSLAAALLQALLHHAALLDPMMASSSRPLSAALLAAAGVYQLSPLKERCLGKCRAPLPFFLTHWRAGNAGALRMGMRHGLYCVGCCAMLMLLLFAVGVMNLAWVATIAALVLVEKLLPAGRVTARAAGAVLLALAAAALLL
jgi:predicted metal-binding membrane protein